LIRWRSSAPGSPARRRAGAGWLDLCCGTGRALVQAAARLSGAGPGAAAVLIGVDLAGLFDPIPPSAAAQLVTASAVTWEPERAFDLITCVHGLHYVGDKLAVLTRAASWLAPGGLLAADLDLRSIRQPGGARTGGLSRGRCRPACSR
jgi:trans-aconitate methyltransferase